MNSGSKKNSLTPYLWLLPSIILIGIFVVFPIMIVFKLSFSEISKSGVVGEFSGFKNYADAVHLPAFKTVMINTFWWVLSVVGLSTLLGFIIALVLNQKFFPSMFKDGNRGKLLALIRGFFQLGGNDGNAGIFFSPGQGRQFCLADAQNLRADMGVCADCQKKAGASL